MSAPSLSLRRAVAIGASAGAVDALSTIFPEIPPAFPWPVLVVVHVPPDKKSLLTEVLGPKCRLPIVEAEDKEPLLPGVVYFAPPDYHLMVDDPQTLALSSEEPVLYSRPSIDVLFESAAEVFGAGLVAVVLTGASSDGAAGARAVHRAGGQTLVQHPELSLASTMPEAALRTCPTALRMTLEEIAAYIRDLADAA